MNCLNCTVQAQEDFDETKINLHNIDSFDCEVLPNMHSMVCYNQKAKLLKNEINSLIKQANSKYPYLQYQALLNMQKYWEKSHHFSSSEGSATLSINAEFYYENTRKWLLKLKNLIENTPVINEKIILNKDNKIKNIEKNIEKLAKENAKFDSYLGVVFSVEDKILITPTSDKENKTKIQATIKQY